MVVILLKMKANLENVKSVDIPPDHTWVLDVKHSTGEEVRERVTLSAAEVHNIPNSRGSANFLVRWDGSKQVSTISIQQLKNVTRLNYDAKDSGKFVPVVAFECRGVEPIKWYPATGYSVKSAKATFNDVDLSEDWVDYDQEASEPVGIYEVEYEFQTYK